MLKSTPSCFFTPSGRSIDDFKQSLICYERKPPTHTEECTTAYLLPVKAVKSQDIMLLRKLLTLMVVKDYTSSEGQLTLLQITVTQPQVNIEMLTELLKHTDASVNKYSHCPLVSTLKVKRAGENQWQTIQLLLDNGADATLLITNGEQSLSVYLHTLKDCFDEMNWSSVIDLLVSKGCQINHVDYRGATPLHAFLYYGIPHTGGKVKPSKITEAQALKVIDKLLSLGADVQNKDKDGYTMLHNAVSAVNVKVCKRLIEAGVNGNVNTAGGGNAFFGLWELDFPVPSKMLSDVIGELIQLLSKEGKVDINMRAFDGSTVIHKAALLSPVQMVEVLISNGADFTLRDGTLNTVLHYALQNEYDDVLGFFIHKGVLDVNARNINRFTPLHLAGLFDDGVMANTLIEAGGDVHLQGQHGIGILHLATIVADVCPDTADCLPILLQNGLDLDKEDDYGCKALYYALFQQNRPYINALQHSGAHELMPMLDMFSVKADIPYGYIASVALRENWQKSSTAELVEKGQKLMALDDLCSHTLFIKNIFKTNQWQAAKNIDFLNEVVVAIVDSEAEENILVRETVEAFVQSVTDAIYQLNPLFRGKLITSGSSYEGVKTHLPNEFDYMIELVCFSDMIQSTEVTPHTGFTMVKGSCERSTDQMRSYLTDDHMLNSNSILSQFKRLLENALLLTHSKGWEHIMKYPGDMESTTAPFISGNQNVLANHKILWTSSTYKLMRISIDINPVVFTPDWPAYCRSNSSLIDNINKRGVFLIPKQPHHIPSSEAVIENFQDIRLWRLSFSHLETDMIQKCKHKNALLLAKAMRMQPVSPKLTSDPNRRPEAILVDDLITTKSQIIPDNSSSESEDFDSVSDGDDELEQEVQEVDADGVIQTYYLKQLFFSVVDEQLDNDEKMSVVTNLNDLIVK